MKKKISKKELYDALDNAEKLVKDMLKEIIQLNLDKLDLMTELQDLKVKLNNKEKQAKSKTTKKTK